MPLFCSPSLKILEMEYSKLISVTGLGGLFELVASKSDGAIVRSLEDKSTKFISSRQHSFSHLESIEVYTQRENVNLVEVFHAMIISSEPLPHEKDATAVKKYFEKVYPEMDFERVYASDMKKMIRWFAMLKKNDIEIKLRDEEAEEVPTDEDKAVEEEATDNEPAITSETAEEGQPAEEKPKAEKAAKEKKPSEETSDETSAKPKKKTARKKAES
jgi:hypothetical protein